MSPRVTTRPCRPTFTDLGSATSSSGVRTESSIRRSSSSAGSTGGKRESCEAARAAARMTAWPSGVDGSAKPMQPLSSPRFLRVTNTPRPARNLGLPVRSSMISRRATNAATDERASRRSSALSSSVSRSGPGPGGASERTAAARYPTTGPPKPDESVRCRTSIRGRPAFFARRRAVTTGPPPHMMLSPASVFRIRASVSRDRMRETVAASRASASSLGRKWERSVDATTRTSLPRTDLSSASASLSMVCRVWVPMTTGTIEAPGNALWTKGIWTSIECSLANASGTKRKPEAFMTARARSLSTRAVPRGVSKPPSGQTEQPRKPTW